MISEKRAKEIYESVNDIGVDGTATEFNLNRESVKRMVRLYRNTMNKNEQVQFDKRNVKC